MRKWAFLAAVLAAALTVSAQSAGAQQLVYTPINPAFGGNPGNTAQLEADAAAQNPFKPVNKNQNLTQSQLFAQQLQSELLSSLANQVAEAIFGPNAQPNGTFSFGGETVSFVRTLGEVTITITDPAGQVTIITLPTAPTGTP
ncbi:MAG TPA: curli assembly protein CsgF [Caulobacteraceae bacterium]|jgi:curli production assembly/transport component CsgF|nr:curli assembly protein CsgF [Caulobacteraceae bacterium]